ncbi:MAG: class I adenylate-forming enzyme family protein, partial [Gammaproteobacteria bacterium]|nr:class I adenylate-forming enzyme family protein [Gammaproteobacteria bacterium]
MQTIRACIEHHAQTSASRTFLIAPGTSRRLSYAELKVAVDDLAVELDRLGLEKGAKVAFLLNNGYWTTQLFLGVMANNRIIVPLNVVAGKVQLQHVLDHSDTEVVFVAPEFREKLAEIIQAIDRTIRVIETDDDSGPDWPDGEAKAMSIASPEAGDTALLLY